jgi:hypothetical protein
MVAAGEAVGIAHVVRASLRGDVLEHDLEAAGKVAARQRDQHPVR